MTETTTARRSKLDRLRWFTDRPFHLLFVAAGFHFALTLTVYELGRQAVLPNMFDTNGVAISFAPDSAEFLRDAASLGEKLTIGDLAEWHRLSYPYHVKLYSISLAALSRLTPSILSVEPLNLFCYLGILILVYQIGKQIFDRRVGLMAAAVVGLWPSFLLHSTQLLRDQLYLTGMLAFVLVNVWLVVMKQSLAKAIVMALLGGLFGAFAFLIRDSMGELEVVSVMLAAVLLVIKQLRERQFDPVNAFGIVLLLFLTLIVVRLLPVYQIPLGAKVGAGPVEENRLNAMELETGNVGSGEASEAKKKQLAPVFGKVREVSANESLGATSNIDSNVSLSSTADVLRYLPRATAIGLFAPFPNMWLSKGGPSGSMARRLSGIEMIIMYLVEALAVVGLITATKDSSRVYGACFLAGLISIGVVALGLVVVNLGTLFRLRYLFLFLLIVLAAAGAVRIFERWRGSLHLSPNLESS